MDIYIYVYTCMYIHIIIITYHHVIGMLTMVAASLAIAMSSQYSIGGIYSK